MNLPFINTSNLAVEYGTFDLEMFSDPCAETRKYEVVA